MIEEYIKLGKINKLEVYKEVEFGVYLKSKEENDEVLLPKRYAKGLKIGDIVDVFVYSDSEDRYVATTDIPFATLGEFGIFEVVDTSEFGAFVEWGLPKHLFVPLSTQKRKLKKGDKVIGIIKYDTKTDRLFLDAKITRNLKKASGFNKNDEVDIFVIAKTPLGYKVIVNNQYEGMIFDNEIFKEIKIADRLKGYVKQNREDGKLDISLRSIGKVKDEAYKILKEYIKTNELTLTPKSSANEIYEVLGISKKAFKSAYNRLKEE